MATVAISTDGTKLQGTYNENVLQQQLLEWMNTSIVLWLRMIFLNIYFIDGGEEEGEEIGEKEGQYFVDQATGQYYFQTSDGETMTVVSAPGVEEPGKKVINLFFHE